MPKDSRYFYDVCHYTNEGSKKVAEILADEIVPFLRTRKAALYKETPSIKNGDQGAREEP